MEGEVSALQISRRLLLLSVLLWAAVLAGAQFEIVPAELALLIGLCAAIVIFFSAVACVIFQFVIGRKSD